MGKGYYLPKDELSPGFLGFIGSEILSSYMGIIENIRLRIYNKLPNHWFPFIVGLVTEGLKTLGGGVGVDTTPSAADRDPRQSPS